MKRNRLLDEFISTVANEKREARRKRELESEEEAHRYAKRAIPH
jgi:hypothetical protein